MKITLDLPSSEELIRKKGFDENGKVQLFHTNNVNRRIGKFMPKQSGALEGPLKQIRDGTEIEISGPYAQYQFHGMAMKGPPPKVVSDKPLDYSKSKNSKAGPYWDRALVAEEGKVIEVELQAYIKRSV